MSILFGVVNRIEAHHSFVSCLHVFRRLNPVAEGPESEQPPYHQKLEPHDEEDGERVHG